MSGRHGGHAESVLGMFDISSGGDGSGSDRYNPPSQRSGMCFGSLSWSLTDSTIGQIGLGPSELVGSHDGSREDDKYTERQIIIPPSDDVEEEGVDLPSSIDRNTAADGSALQQEKGLLEGLRPMRDRYLGGVLSRVTSPVHLVFIPSLTYL